MQNVLNAVVQKSNYLTNQVNMVVCIWFFLVFCIFTGVRSLIYYKYHREETTGLIPTVILLIFGVCGMVERVFFPYYAIGAAFLLMVVLLLPKCDNELLK